MKRSKIVFLVIIFLIVFLLLTISNVSRAAIANISLKITQERNAEIGWTTDQNTNKGSYKIKYQLYTDDTGVGSKTKNVWKLEEASNSSGEKLDNLYCIRAGLGFATETGHVDGTVKTYNQVYDLTKDYETVQSIFNSSSVTLFKTDSKANYNAVMWILDHMILEDAEDTEVEKYLWDNVYKALADEYDYEEEDVKLVTSGMRFDILSKADIEAIQQLAIWHFSNKDEAVYNEEMVGQTLQIGEII